MDKVAVQIHPSQRRFAQSPFFFVIAALQGVAITFAPLALYWCGKGQMSGLEPIIAPVCFGVIFFVSLFYYMLGSAVVKELRKKSD